MLLWPEATLFTPMATAFSPLALAPPDVLAPIAMAPAAWAEALLPITTASVAFELIVANWEPMMMPPLALAIT